MQIDAEFNAPVGQLIVQKQLLVFSHPGNRLTILCICGIVVGIPKHAVKK